MRISPQQHLRSTGRSLSSSGASSNDNETLKNGFDEIEYFGLISNPNKSANRFRIKNCRSVAETAKIMFGYKHHQQCSVPSATTVSRQKAKFDVHMFSEVEYLSANLVGK